MRRPRTLLVGTGGREHAIGAALHRSEAPLFVAGPDANPGLVPLAQQFLQVAVTEKERIVNFAKVSKAELAVIGPEAAIAAGVADQLRAAGVPTVGPSAAAGKLESSKAFARELMTRHQIPGLPTCRVVRKVTEIDTALAEFSGPVVVKASGLAGGKGVWVEGPDLANRSEAAAQVRKLLAPQGKEAAVVLEERLEGEEFSLLAFVDGTRVFPMPLVQDYKRAGEGNTGPNTGGMGSYSERDHRLPFLTEADLEAAAGILRGTLDALRKDGLEFRGILYGGFMVTSKGVQVLEFNARFGDPEALNVLTIFDGTDFADLMLQVANGKVDPSHVSFRLRATVCKYLVPIGYPSSSKTGQPIRIDPQELLDLGVTVYYGSVTPGRSANEVLTGNSRALALVGESSARKDAELRVEQAIQRVRGEFTVRHDIGTTADVKARVDHMAKLRSLPAFDPVKNPTRSGPSPPVYG